MEIIKTTAPIPIEELKKFFVNQETRFIIDYKTSKLKGLKLLTYLSNLDIPCDIDADPADPEFNELLKDYLNCPFIVNTQLLEFATIKLLFEARGLIEVTSTEFINDNREVIDRWISLLDSLTLYNMYVINDDSFKDFVKSHPVDDDFSRLGINFVSLLKHKEFYTFYDALDKTNMKYYKIYFDDYMFKGKNLYYYWATEHNPLFLLTWSVASGNYQEELEKISA
jgi:hypothetical protein